MSKQNSVVIDGEEYLSNQQIATELRVATYTVREWIASGKLKAVKVGAHWRTPRSEFLRFVQERYSGNR